MQTSNVLTSSFLQSDSRQRITMFVKMVLTCCFLLSGGCSPDDHRNSGVKNKNHAVTEQEERRVKAEQIRSRLKELREEMDRREHAWKADVNARHRDWTPEQMQHNMNILLEKWDTSNFSTIDETVRCMGIHGSRVLTHDLSIRDYRDIATHRFAIQSILYHEYKRLLDQLGTIDVIKAGDDWNFIYRYSYRQR